jgi:serine/threonine protein kinase
MGKTLGEGAYATVFEGVWRGEKVAIKKIKMDAMDGSAGANVFSEFRREAWLMRYV